MSRVIKASDIINDLHSGITRKIGDKHYNENVGSIQEKYNLTTEEVNILFRNDVLKKIKLKPYVPVSFTFEDDINNSSEENNESTCPSSQHDQQEPIEHITAEWDNTEQDMGNTESVTGSLESLT